MILKQYYLGCLAQASYLIADRETGRAALVDPRRDVREYLDDARDLGLAIEHVFLSHFHADFVSGHIEINRRTGATIRMGARADAEFAFVPMEDGEDLSLGSVRLTVLETPGHTPESICIVVRESPGAAPHAVLTGDTLFIGDVGRPDLMASSGITAEELAGRLFDSIHRKLLTLPDATLVYPAHGAGSMCGKNLSAETVSTIGDQRRFNYALQPMSRSDFIRLVTSDQPEAPDYFAYDAMMNRSNRITLEQSLAKALSPISIEGALELRAQGAVLLDTRDPDTYAACHLAGSVNIALGGSYAIWAGTVLESERPIVILAEAGHEEEAILRLGRVGLDRVAGFVRGGPAAFAERPDLIRSAVRISPRELARALAGASPPVVLDVRNVQERAARRVPGSVHLPLHKLRARTPEIPMDRPIVVYCAGGYRSSIAASILRSLGHGEVMDLIGGIDAWVAAGFDVAAASPLVAAP